MKNNLSNSKPIFIFILMWSAYASCYLLRKPFGLIKGSIQDSLNLSKNDLGYIDLAFSLPYALVSLFFSSIGDRIGPRITLGGGLIGSAIASSTMGTSNNYLLLLFLIFILGSFQSITWPAACAILSTWFSKNTLTTLMGLFGTSLLVGGLLSATLTIKVAELYSWHSVFYIPSAIVLFIGLLVLVFAKNNIDKIDSIEKNAETPMDVASEPELQNHMNFIQILRLPIVFNVSMCLFFIKGIRNAMLFWLPYYLSQHLNYSYREAGYISLVFEIGGLLSVPLTILIDKCMAKNDLLAISIFNFLLGCSTIVLFLGNSYGSFYLYLSLFVSGALSSSSEITLCGAMATKLGNKYGAKNSIIGLVNGIGSLGNVIEGPVISYLISMFGLQSLIPFVTISSFLALFMSLFALFTQIKGEMKNKYDQSISKTDL